MGDTLLWAVKNGDLDAIKKCIDKVAILGPLARLGAWVGPTWQMIRIVLCLLVLLCVYLNECGCMYVSLNVCL